MSLDISLRIIKTLTCECCNSVYTDKSYEVYDGNITHNLGTMAKEAGIYQILWHPEKLGITFASEIIKQLEYGLKLLKNDPEYYKTFSSKNGWGLYEDFVPFVEKYLNACKEYPEARIVSDC